VTLSTPYLDPYSQRRTSDWLVVERTTGGAMVHRFTSREKADAWRQELADHPELDTDDRALDARREALRP
jgi:hypothetical protein